MYSRLKCLLWRANDRSNAGITTKNSEHFFVAFLLSADVPPLLPQPFSVFCGNKSDARKLEKGAKLGRTGARKILPI